MRDAKSFWSKSSTTICAAHRPVPATRNLEQTSSDARLPMPSRSRPEVETADPSQWCEQSQRSVSAGWTTVYRDISYNCWSCKAPAVFTAQDQKRSFEVKKAPIVPVLRTVGQFLANLKGPPPAIVAQDPVLIESKTALMKDKSFLSGWLELLELLEKFVPYRPDTAKKNMIRRLLQDA
jgi:hypothetical protein